MVIVVKSLSVRDAKGSKFHYYLCGTPQKKEVGSCQALYISKDKLKQGVNGKLKEHILNYENLKELIKLVNEEMDSVIESNTECLNIVSAEIDNVNQRLERLYDTLEKGILKLADLAPRIQRLGQQLE